MDTGVESTTVEFDRESQMERIQPYLLPGETLLAVYDLKAEEAALLGLTDRRIIFYDRAFLGRKSAMVALSYWRMSAIACEEPGERGFSSLTLHINTTGARSYDVHFWSKEKAHRAYTIIAQQMMNREDPDWTA